MFDISFTGEAVNDEGVTQHLGVMTLGVVTEGIAASFADVPQNGVYPWWR